jgi:hypothetical protein
MAVVEMLEVPQIDGRHGGPGKAAARVLAVVPEILAHRTVHLAHAGCARVDQLAPVGVEHEQDMQRRQFGGTGAQELVQARQRLGACAIGFDPLDHAQQQGVGYLDGVLGVLGQRVRHVRGGDLFLAQLHVAGIPEAPHELGGERQAPQDDEGHDHGDHRPFLVVQRGWLRQQTVLQWHGGQVTRWQPGWR